ncbi:hypothetical protein BJ170DRAFT_596891 [Xylariales sp. AK1849]|nr:hypothetical protein BJ170DRAFT_596891 [Xylariales sp. AK1849]
MGRKPAPQPLSLAEPRSHSQAQGLNESIDDTSVSPGALASSSAPNSSALGSHGRRSPHVPGVSGETSLQVVSTSTSSKSTPRSPRSPFSKFSASNKNGTGPEPRQTHAHAQPPSQLQSKFSLQQPQASPKPHFDYQAGPVPETYEQDYYHYSQQPRTTSPSEQQLVDQIVISKPNADASSTAPNLSEGTGPNQHTVHQPPPPPPQPSREEEKHTRSASRFFNFKSSRPREQARERPRDQARDYHRERNATQNLSLDHTNSSSEAMSRGADHPITSDRVSGKTSKSSDHSAEHHATHSAMATQPARSDLSLASGEYDTHNSKKSKPKPFALLNRSRSVKEKESSGSKETLVQVKIQEPERAHTFAGQPPLKTAPADKEGQDRAYRQMMNSSTRNHSADHAVPRERPNKDVRSDKEHSQNRSQPSSFKDSSGATFFSGLKSSGSRAADMLSKGFFGSKGSRNNLSEREHRVDDEHYQIKYLNLPLIEQTRKTRISKRLEDSRDKTEFWMPAFPWRAIDYLNYKGSDVEGLYRVPGSGPQIKKWQRRFDEEHDVDLFAQDDLYDINIIGSMLKAWLRELPDELFPKEAQERIARECAGAEQVPQLLIDELSDLSPYNYYLLFAITCHLSLLLAHSDKNKMDFRNLCICFQPCMKIDAFCFRFLVCDWRACWQGCKNEAFYIEEEYALLHQPPPRGLGASPSQHIGVTPSQQDIAGPQHHDDDYGVMMSNGNGNGNVSNGRRENAHSQEERNISSSESVKPTMLGQGQDQQHNSKIRKKPLQPGVSVASISTGLSVERQEPLRRSGELRPLSPIKPLSPLGF